MKLFDGIQWIFFDLGSTLIDEEPQMERLVEDIREAFLRFDLDYAPEQIRSTMVRAMMDYSPMLRTTIFSLARSEEQLEEVGSRLHRDPALERLYPGVLAALETLSRHYRLGVIANLRGDGQEKLSRLGLTGLFSACLFSGEQGVAKPEEELFRRAVEQAGCPPAQVLMVGDRLDQDIYPANRVGMKTVRILQGLGRYQPPKGLGYQPTAIIRRIQELAPLLEATYRGEREPVAVPR